MKKNHSTSVEFACNAPDAKTVFVAGTFNDWRPQANPLSRQTDGHWKTTLPIPHGHHEFKFIVDGKWCCEPGCEHEYQGCAKCVSNEFGTMNRVLEVNGDSMTLKPHVRVGVPDPHGGLPLRTVPT